MGKSRAPLTCTPVSSVLPSDRFRQRSADSSATARVVVGTGGNELTHHLGSRYVAEANGCGQLIRRLMTNLLGYGEELIRSHHLSRRQPMSTKFGFQQTLPNLNAARLLFCLNPVFDLRFRPRCSHELQPITVRRLVGGGQISTMSPLAIICFSGTILPLTLAPTQ